tara:strand:- start:19 stop:483 length:465 start_codon:yes stop_codon:yes gene_type:complete
MVETNNFFKNNILEKSQYALLFIPMLAVYLPTIVYPVTEEIGNNVSFRPPGYVFAIVWPILLFLLGISWYVRRKMGYFINSVYILLIVLLSIWFILYDNNKYYGLVDIIICFLIVLFLFFYNIKKFNKYSSLPLIPLLCWLIFASILNVASINN